MWVTWLPVSNNAVTGFPFITNGSSLALPINLAQGSIDDLFLSEMHIVYARISKAVLDTVLDTLLTSMEQAILKESLFLWGCTFLQEFIMDLGQESLNLCSKGRD